MSGLVKLQTDLKLLIKNVKGYEERLTKHLEKGYEIVKDSEFITVLQNLYFVETDKKKICIKIDMFIDDDMEKEDKLEKLSDSLFDTVESFKNEGIEIDSISILRGLEDD